MSKSSKFGLGVVFGAIAGAVTALLSAPKSGKETREELKKLQITLVQMPKKS